MDWTGKEMIKVDVYADTTGCYTEDELMRCNVTTITVPKELVKMWYEKNEDACIEECKSDRVDPSFENWLSEVYICDSMDGFYDFCEENGFTPACGKECNDWIWYVKGE